MQPRKIADGLSVSDQITAEDVDLLGDQGFRAIICNRPDGEGPDQANFGDIAAAASRAGLEARHVPVRSGRWVTQMSLPSARR